MPGRIRGFAIRISSFGFPPVWTPRQARVVAAFVLLLGAALLVLRAIDPATVPDPPPAVGDRADELLARLDPNAADAAALSAIPRLGPKGAANVVAFRTAYGHDHPGRVAFAQPRDLMHVRGIGPAIRDAMAPYLRFPPSTRP